MARVFGHVGVVGQIYADRDELSRAGVHRPPMAGISGTGAEGADSIVVSGGYEDDEDLDDIIIYTGQGGNDPVTKLQVADQELTRGNLALVRNYEDGLPVRVVRGARGKSQHSPPYGYRYDGLYFVEEYWSEIGRAGHLVWRYRLVKDNTPATLFRQVRVRPTIAQVSWLTTPLARQVKVLHDYRCQVCAMRLETAAGPYAEGVHIQPLGLPHDGPDDLSNILCLCPNHRVQFRSGFISVRDDLELLGTAGRLRSVDKHKIGREFLAYHREHYARLVRAPESR